MKRTIGAALAAVAMALSTPAFATDFVLTANPGNANAFAGGVGYFVYNSVVSTPTHVEATLGGTGANTSPDSFFFGIKPFAFTGGGSGTRSDTPTALTFTGPIQLWAYTLGASAGTVNNLLDVNFSTTTNEAGAIRALLGSLGGPSLIVSGTGPNPSLQQVFSNVLLSPDVLYEIRVPHSTSGGAYTGTLTADAVPEPATWAMMLAGFGLVGFAMRRQRQSHPKVRFAF